MSRTVPLRNFIFDRLYHPTHGYFCKPNFQVGELKAPINFRNLLGYDDYQRELANKYPNNAWLTPCEIFKPYYGMTIAKYLKAAYQHHRQKNGAENKIRIVEAGAGTGSAAESILYFFSNYHRELLPLIEYNIVEISPALCKRIQQKLTQSFPQMMRNKQIKVLNQDISDYKNSELCFVMFFQVLDNLPHDKVLWNAQQKCYDKFVTVDMQSRIEGSQPIEKDHLIKECLQLYLRVGEQKKVASSTLDRIASYFVERMIKKKIDMSCVDVFLPTFMYRLMKRIRSNIPRAHLVISDFDKLVTSIPGINAPIVSKKGLGSAEKFDYSNYLVQRGQADIFFPVNFGLLQAMHLELLQRKAKVVKSYQFIGEFSEQSWAQTKSDFNPIREDFGNTSFLVSDVSQ